ncbi:MAG: DUF4197 domain-containing protein [Gammaproteobacteria bacterium]|nr:DUF4197 domain-containing protein [Gammaproteobacteria bacterium]
MKPLLIAILTLSLLACSEKDLRETFKIISTSADEIPLTTAEVVAALKDSLSRGITKGANLASLKDGYLGNPELKIEFPEDLHKVEKALRKIGLGKDVDRFVRQLNRGAEKAASKAKPVFIKAITSMTISDAFEILNGAPDAATQYLQRTTGAELRTQFLPIVSDSLKQTSATRYYGEIVEKYNKLPLVSDVDPDLESYATDKAITGLFVLIAEEEASIRANPAARTTKLLRRVFGSLDQAFNTSRESLRFLAWTVTRTWKESETGFPHPADIDPYPNS